MPAKAEIITIGDEILYGQTLDTNSHWLSGALDRINIRVYRKTIIGDDENHILAALREAESAADVILMTGGLGPTADDLTKPALAKYFGVDLILNREALTEIKALFSKANRPMSVMNEKQAELPANCEKITNTMGTAPGMWFEERGKVLVAMPGVPYEMKAMMEQSILPRLKKKYLKEVIIHRMVKTVGVPESRLAERIKAWEAHLPHNQKLAYLPAMGQVKLRITGTGQNANDLSRDMEQSIKSLLPLVKEHVFGFNEDVLEGVIGNRLREQGATVATAESCTGGSVAAAITGVPGSSDYFKGSVIAYENAVKTEQLNVDPQTIEAHGAVSEEVVKQMAENVRKYLKTDIGIATSGIAGPGGGTPQKPVGTIWLGYSDARKTVAKKMNFTKDRKLNIQFATVAALNMLRMNI